MLERFNGTLVMLGERGERGAGGSGGGNDWNQDSAPRGNFGGARGGSDGGGGGRPAAFDSDLDDDVPF